MPTACALICFSIFQPGLVITAMPANQCAPGSSETRTKGCGRSGAVKHRLDPQATVFAPRQKSGSSCPDRYTPGSGAKTRHTPDPAHGQSKTDHIPRASAGLHTPATDTAGDESTSTHRVGDPPAEPRLRSEVVVPPNNPLSIRVLDCKCPNAYKCECLDFET